jgi:hypothetical protein
MIRQATIDPGAELCREAGYWRKLYLREIGAIPMDEPLNDYMVYTPFTEDGE